MMMTPAVSAVPQLPHSTSARHQQANPNPKFTQNNNRSNINRLYVGSIPWDATEEEVISECSIFGRVVSFKLVPDKTGKHRHMGYGFIDFADEEGALCAKRNQKGLLCRGRQLKVCDPVNNNKQQQQQHQKSPSAPLSFPSVSSSCLPTNNKRPREAAAVPAADDSVKKGCHVQQQAQLPQSNYYPIATPAPRLHVPPAPITTHHQTINPPVEAKASDADQYTRSSSIPAMVTPQNNNVEKAMCSAIAASSEDEKQPLLVAKPITVIDHVDFAEAVRSAGRTDVVITDQRFIGDLIELLLLLRKKITPLADVAATIL